MKLWPLLTCILFLCSCGKVDKGQADPQGLPDSTSASSSASTEPTPEQLAATVRVRVIFGGLPPQDTSGALLHRDEFNGFIPPRSKDRLVIANLSGWREDQLKSPLAQIRIFRNMADKYGEQVAMNSKARLLQFYPEKGVALLTYQEKYDAIEDVGFRLEHTTSADDSCLLLSTSLKALESNPSGGRSAKETLVIASSPYRGGTVSWNDAHMELKGELEKGVSLLMVRSPAVLSGFAAFGPKGKPTVTAVPDLKLTSSRFKFETLGVSIEQPRIGTTDFVFSLIGKAGEGSQPPPEMWARIARVPQGSLNLAQESEVAQMLNATRTHIILSKDKKDSDRWNGTLYGFDFGKEEMTFLIQPYWFLLPGEKNPSTGGTAFLIKFEKREEGLFPIIEGVADLTPKPLVAKHISERKFPLEAKARNLHPIRGGTEVLVEFEGAPFWKRFSFTKNDWIPLPGIDLSKCSLTGNLNSLFVLERSTPEIRRYSLESLQPVAAVKLPTKSGFFSIIAGCLTDRAPVYILSSKEAVALSPDDLQQLSAPLFPQSSSSPSEISFNAQDTYMACGDGLSFWKIGKGHFRTFYTYSSALKGVQRTYFDLEAHEYQPEHAQGVSGAFDLNPEVYTVATPDGKRMRGPSLKEHAQSLGLLTANCPINFRILPGQEGAVPPRPTRIEFVPFFGKDLFAAVNAPEVGGAHELVAFARGLLFDPTSFRLGTLAKGRKEWIVRDVAPVEKSRPPVLLNWPNPILKRGEDFHFQPLIKGGAAKVSAEIIGRPGLAVVDPATNAVTIRVPKGEAAALMLLSLKVEGEGDHVLTYPIPLHMAGPPILLAAPRSLDPQQLPDYGTTFKKLGNAVPGLKALPTSLHRFPSPALDVQGPVAGYLALVTDASRIDLFSLQARKITHSLPSAPGAYYYGGAGALFEFHPGKHALTRISIPEGKRESSIALPPGVRLSAIGIGTHATSPVTLLLEGTDSETVSQFGDVTITDRRFSRRLVVLNNRTLQAGGWAQPVSIQKLYGLPELPNVLNFPVMEARPITLRTSPSGQLLTMSGSDLVLGAGLSAVWPMTDQERLRKSEGKVTPCGRYRIKGNDIDWVASPILEILGADTEELLFRVGGSSVLAESPSSGSTNLKNRLMMLGENGPLALFNRAGDVMQLADCSIPDLAREMNPAALHVTSVPVSYVLEGTTFQYQITVNNPGAFAECRLQGSVPGASITPQGLLRYTAPTGLVKPTKEHIAIDVISKTGEKQVHNVPLSILPIRRAMPVKKPGSI